MICANGAEGTGRSRDLEGLRRGRLRLEAQLGVRVAELLITIEWSLLVHVLGRIADLIESRTICGADVLDREARVVEAMLRWHLPVMLMQRTVIWSAQVAGGRVVDLSLIELRDVNVTAVAVGIVADDLLVVRLLSSLQSLRPLSCLMAVGHASVHFFFLPSVSTGGRIDFLSDMHAMLVLDEVLRCRVDLAGAHARLEIAHGLK